MKKHFSQLVCNPLYQGIQRLLVVNLTGITVKEGGRR